MDEVEAALDDVNLGRLLTLMQQLREKSQLIIITHQKRTMEIADALYGVTMRGGVTEVISQRLTGPRTIGPLAGPQRIGSRLMMIGVVRDRAVALLIDLDGVVRVFDPAVAAAAERRHDLPDGELCGVAFAWGRLRPAIAGECTHEEWLDSIVTELAATPRRPARGPGRSRGMAGRSGPARPRGARVRPGAARGPGPGRPGHQRHLPARRRPGPLGLAGEFDVVVNSSVIGAHKPPRVLPPPASRWPRAGPLLLRRRR